MAELTVEAALKELREMFPSFEGAIYDLVRQQLTIQLFDNWDKHFSGSSFSDCLSKAREFAAWRESQDG